MNLSIVLLRGINVGKHKRIKMAELKLMLEKIGCNRVQTYIQSGNVVLESEEAPDTLSKRIEQQLQTAFGLSVTVFVTTAADFKKILEDCPFAADELPEGEEVQVVLLADTPAQEDIDRLPASGNDNDE
jgi:uncharacterized protein (DUF1697 family)